MKVTEQQLEVLLELLGCQQAKHAGKHFDLPDGRRVRMYAPLEFGGTTRSHHSGTATALAKKGLVDRYKYDGRQLNVFKCRNKGACVYALTDAGRSFIATLGVK